VRDVCAVNQIVMKQMAAGMRAQLFSRDPTLITDLFVAARFRGKGIGERALEIACEHCRAQGINAIELQVESENRAAQGFYRKHGFEQLSRIVMLREVDKPAKAVTPVLRRKKSSSG